MSGSSDIQPKALIYFFSLAFSQFSCKTYFVSIDELFFKFSWIPPTNKRLEENSRVITH